MSRILEYFILACLLAVTAIVGYSLVSPIVNQGIANAVHVLEPRR